MELKDFFRENPKIALAFSGGVDSAYLLYAAVEAGADVTAYYVKSAFQPQFELEDAMRLVEDINRKALNAPETDTSETGCSDQKVAMRILPVDVLASEKVCQNPPDRCYHCKQVIFNTILKAAEEDGYTVLCDGTNASDDAGDRPGMRALKELLVRSPLRECGLTKTRIRELSKEAGLFTWNKPAYACLATRIPTGETITLEKLEATEKAEDFLFSLGFTDFRVRRFANGARIQMPENQLPKILEHREEILNTLKQWYPQVLLDLEVR